MHGVAPAHWRTVEMSSSTDGRDHPGSNDVHHQLPMRQLSKTNSRKPTAVRYAYDEARAGGIRGPSGTTLVFASLPTVRWTTAGHGDNQRAFARERDVNFVDNAGVGNSTRPELRTNNARGMAGSLDRPSTVRLGVSESRIYLGSP